MSNSSFSRRDFLSSTSAFAASAAIAGRRPHIRWWPARPGVVQWTAIDPAQIKIIAQRAVDVAMSSGATYADVRVTRTRHRMVSFVALEGEEFELGIRALVDGHWGLVATTIWTTDEATRVGREAVVRAHAIRGNRRAGVVLAPTPVVRDGHWTMPVEIDPMMAPIEELFDEIHGIVDVFSIAPPEIRTRLNTEFLQQDKAFASSDGTYVTQTCYQSFGELIIVHRGQEIISDRFTVAGRGWEYLRGQLHAEVLSMMAEAERLAALPVKAADVGRYDVVFDGWAVAQLADATIGAATELDRAMGYEANSVGTSYLTSPDTMRGTERIGTPAISVTADRSLPGGAATVQWDDEGVAPDSFALVKDGVVTDFQTTRESASWLASSHGLARSHGCAVAQSGSMMPMTQTPNLRMTPGTGTHDLDALIADCAQGLLVTRAAINPDPGCSTGMGFGTTCEIRNGKVVARLPGSAFLFRAKDLWTGVLGLGGAASLRPYGIRRNKGEPGQNASHTVVAPPAAFKQLSCFRIGGAV